LIQGKILSYGDNNLSEAYNIRQKFFVEEFNLPEESEFDEYDKEAMHVLVYDNSENRKAVATGRISYDGNLCLISKVSVLKEYRNLKYGDFTVRMLINKAFTSGIREVYVNALPTMMEFYKKIGFIQTEKVYTELEITYNVMVISDCNVVRPCKHIVN